LRARKEVNVWSISCTSGARLWVGVGCGMRDVRCGLKVGAMVGGAEAGWGVGKGEWQGKVQAPG